MASETALITDRAGPCRLQPGWRKGVVVCGWIVEQGPLVRGEWAQSVCGLLLTDPPSISRVPAFDAIIHAPKFPCGIRLKPDTKLLPARLVLLSG